MQKENKIKTDKLVKVGENKLIDGDNFIYEIKIA